MDQYENTPEKGTKRAKQVLGVIVIVLAVSAAVYAVYLLGQDNNPANGNVNSGSNANTTANINSERNTNRQASNTNAAITNTLGNTNAGAWQPYSNSDLGISLTIPNGWSVEEHSSGVNYVAITNTLKDRVLTLGVRDADDDSAITSRTLFFADQGDGYTYENSSSVSIQDTNVAATILVHSDKVKEWYLGTSGNVFPKIGSHEIYAEYAVRYPLSDNDTYNDLRAQTDLSDELALVRSVVESLTFLK